MRSRPTHGLGYAGTRPDRSGIREEADAQRPGPGARPAPIGTVALRGLPLWTKARPLTLGLLGLALAVVLWGLEYKVSLYHPHPNRSARINIAKLWVGPRTAAFAKNNCVRTSATHSPALHLLNTCRTRERPARPLRFRSTRLMLTSPQRRCRRQRTFWPDRHYLRTKTLARDQLWTSCCFCLELLLSQLSAPPKAS
jgi:hypothetical protein